MNVKFMNPFVEAANEVLHSEVQLSVERGDLSLRKSAFTANEITVLICLVGQVQGVVIYGMSIATGLEDLKLGVERIAAAARDRDGFAAFVQEGERLY